MEHLILLILLSVSIGVAQSTIKPYPRYSEFCDGVDTGEPIFLTPYIEKGQIELAKNVSLVHHDDMEKLTSYAGYLTVNREYNSNMFFWFFPAKWNQPKAPVVLWLQGGPDASSLYGLLAENGPFFVTTKKRLRPRKYSWHLHHNLLYIDNPVGTGYSFTDDDAGYAKNKTDVGNRESYAGKYIPAMAHVIHKHSNSPDPADRINLQGLAIGNGLTDPVNQLQHGAYLYQLGLIDSNGRRYSTTLRKKDGTVFQNLTGYKTYYNYLKPDGDPSISVPNMGEFLQMSATRKAIHVGNNTFHDLKGENKVEEHLRGDIMASVKDWVAELLEHYKVLIYNGQLDIIVAYPSMVNYLKKLEFNAADDYKTAKRYIWKLDNQIAGYVKRAGNLTEVLVRGAGHMAPADQPKRVLDMLLRMTYAKKFFEIV